MELDPSFPATHSDMGAALERLGRNDEAIAAYLKAAKLSGTPDEVITAQREAYQAGGMRGFWQKRLDTLKKLSERQRVSPLSMAMAHARLDEKDQALAWLEKAVEDRVPPVIHIKSFLEFENLRSDPRYAALLRRMRLAP
jgi:tetratricopeptide (TPR) repeat protein